MDRVAPVSPVGGAFRPDNGTALAQIMAHIVASPRVSAVSFPLAQTRDHQRTAQRASQGLLCLGLSCGGLIFSSLDGG